MEFKMAGFSEEALEKLNEKAFDLVLCDLVLPLSGMEEEHASDSAMVGVHCMHEIRKLYPAIPVIAISGELVGSPLDAVRGFGACATLSKPFGRKELLNAVGDALGTRGQDAH